MNIVLFGLSLDEYKEERKKIPSLPPIQEVVCKEWLPSARKFGSKVWHESCEDLSAEMKKSDAQGSRQKWHQLLQDLDTEKTNDFPSPDWLYRAKTHGDE